MIKTQPKIENGSPDPSVQGKDGETAGTDFESQMNKYPALCRTCTKQFGKFRCEGHPDDGLEFACGLMVEAQGAGVPMLACAHRVVKIAPIIDADTMQAATGIRGVAAAIRDTVFADAEPFDPAKFVMDVIGS